MDDAIEWHLTSYTISWILSYKWCRMLVTLEHYCSHHTQSVMDELKFDHVAMREMNKLGLISSSLPSSYTSIREAHTDICILGHILKWPPHSDSWLEIRDFKSTLRCWRTPDGEPLMQPAPKNKRTPSRLTAPQEQCKLWELYFSQLTRKAKPFIIHLLCTCILLPRPIFHLLTHEAPGMPSRRSEEISEYL